MTLLIDKLEGIFKHNNTFHFSEEHNDFLLLFIDYLVNHKIQFILKSYSINFI